MRATRTTSGSTAVIRSSSGDICISSVNEGRESQILLSPRQAVQVALELLQLTNDLIQPYPLIIADVSIDAPSSLDDHATLYVELSGRSVPVLVDLQQVADAVNSALASLAETGKGQRRVD